MKSCTKHRGGEYAGLTLLWAGHLLFAFWAGGASAQEATARGANCADLGCHTEQLQSGDPHRQGLDSSDCLKCHVPLGDARHSFAQPEDYSGSCLTCHDLPDPDLHQHAPVSEGACTYCHNAHKSEQKALLKLAPNELCMGCHVRLVPTDEFVVHGPVADRECTACHESHASSVEGLLTKAAPSLCFDCHDKDQKDHDGRLLPAVEPTFVDKSLHQHPPFARGLCLMCHDPHSSGNYRLQRWPYQPAFYTDLSEEIYACLMCHGDTTFAEPRTVTTTQFRNGNLNLHYRHVSRDKGRGCRACHHQHMSRLGAQIAANTFMGSEDVGIKEFAKTASGGSCTPMCHRSVRYDRIEPVDNQFRVTPREGVDATATELRQANVGERGSLLYLQRCAGCHDADASGKIGPAIAGVTIDQVLGAVNRVDLMNHLTHLDSADLHAIVASLPGPRAVDSPAGAETTAAEGLAAFAANCAGCHGSEAGGRVGPAIKGASPEKIKAAITQIPMMIAMKSLDAPTIDRIAEHLEELAEMEIGEHLVRDGAAVFAKKCSECHGANAEGRIGPGIQGATVVLAIDAITHVPMMGEMNALSAEELEAVGKFLASLVETPRPDVVARSAIDGEAIFANTCALCHAMDARGRIGSDIRGLSGQAIADAIRSVPLMNLLRVFTRDEIDAVGLYLQGLNEGNRETQDAN